MRAKEWLWMCTAGRIECEHSWRRGCGFLPGSLRLRAENYASLPRSKSQNQVGFKANFWTSGSEYFGSFATSR